MRLWLITIGEPLPTDGAGVRLLRAGMIANLLVEKGHQIVWWSSAFDHVKKTHRFNSNMTVQIKKNYELKLLHALAYQKNVSIRRIVNHIGIASKFAKMAELEDRPDIILCSLPTVELCLAATNYGKKNGVPVVIDVRDLWPDIFVELLPSWGHRFARLLLCPMFRSVRSACANATAIIGITPDFVDWGLTYANRGKKIYDKDFPLGYSQVVPAQEAIKEAKKSWYDKGIIKEDNEFIACFFGTMGRQFELDTVIEAARRLKNNNRSFRFVLCGSGDNFVRYKSLADDCQNIIFPGWVNAADIWTLMNLSSVGLAPYQSSKDFQSSIPNKAIEYLSSGLPLVSSLKGVLRDLLSEHSCGVTYENGDAGALASILVDLYDHRERLNKMSKNAHALYEEKFVAENVYGKLIGYLESVCNNYRGNQGDGNHG